MKVSPSECDDDERPEVERLTLETAILPFLVIGRRRSSLDNFRRARSDRRLWIYRWNFDDFCHMSKRISGFGDHVVISGCCLWTVSSRSPSSPWSTSRIRC